MRSGLEVTVFMYGRISGEPVILKSAVSLLIRPISSKPVSGPRQNLFPVGRLLESKVFHASRHLYGSGVRKP
jgi:hypothetical protein